MPNLIKETFVFRVENESQVAALIEEQKNSSKGIVNHKADYKTKKSKGEIIDSWWIVTITHDYSQ